MSISNQLQACYVPFLDLNKILRIILRISIILRIRIFVNRKILTLRIFLRKTTILGNILRIRLILRIRIFVNTGPGVFLLIHFITVVIFLYKIVYYCLNQPKIYICFFVFHTMYISKVSMPSCTQQMQT